MEVAAGLTRALERLGIPIVSVSIGSTSDRSTWTIQFKPAATTQQRADGNALKLTYDPATDTVGQDEEAQTEIDSSKALRAVVRATHELKTNAWTLGQYADRIKAIYKTLS